MHGQKSPFGVVDSQQFSRQKRYGVARPKANARIHKQFIHISLGYAYNYMVGWLQCHDFGTSGA